MIDSNILTAVSGVGALFIAIATFYILTSSKFLSIREHMQYNEFVIRELDRVSNRISVLEQTRPTTGEIEARMNGVRFKER